MRTTALAACDRLIGRRSMQIKMHVSLNRQLQERVSLTSPRSSAPPTGAALLCTSLKPERPFALSPRHGAGASVQVPPVLLADVGGVSPAPVQMWEWCDESGCRCGR